MTPGFPKDYKILHSSNDGFAIGVNDQIYVSYRGALPTDETLRDILINGLQIGIGKFPNRQIILTGHSLGGYQTNNSQKYFGMG